MSDDRYSMTQECTNSYLVEEQHDGEIVITIHVPKRFAFLWMSKLTDMTTTDAEIAEHEPED